MSTRHFCTYFDHNYLPRGMVMLESLHKHCPEAHVHVLCLSDECHAALTVLAYPHVSLIRLAGLEAADPELADARLTRSLIEYYFTITPCLPWHLLTRCEGIDEITYLDADMMFFSSPEPIFEEAKDASVIVTPHRFAAHLADYAKYGLYNVSWMTFRNTPEGLACLSWYREACLEWCKDELEVDRFADQKYLDFFPQKFTGVHAMRHPGGGVAPWNLVDAAVNGAKGAVTVDGKPLIFYHAHGFKHLWGPFYSSGFLEYASGLTKRSRRGILNVYSREYARKVKATQAAAFGNSFGSIRDTRKDKAVLWKTCKMIVREWRKRTLVICCA